MPLAHHISVSEHALSTIVPFLCPFSWVLAAELVSSILLIVAFGSPSLTGRMPDASTGESAHQARKRVNASSSNRNAALHYARRSNMDLAIVALAEGVPWQLTRFDRGRKHYVVQTVTPGAGCTAVLRMLGDALPGGLSSAPTDSRTASTPTAAESRGQFVGAANWSSTLLESGGGGGNPGSWEASVATGLLRPDERTLLDGYTTFFSCGRSSGPVCLEERCSTCWDNPSTLDIKEIECSRFKHGASPRSSSGLRRWKGGNAKAAARVGQPLAWALGEDAGEDVEFYTKQPFNDSSPSGALSSARILYFLHTQREQALRNPGAAVDVVGASVRLCQRRRQQST